MTGGGSFRYTVWDPFMIVSQMSTLQCLYYVSLGIWIFVFDVLSGTPRSLDHIFQYQVCIFQNVFFLQIFSHAEIIYFFVSGISDSFVRSNSWKITDCCPTVQCINLVSHGL